VVVKPSYSSLQSMVALLAGLTSIGGATYSALGYLRSTPEPGEMVAVVREAGTERPVAGAVVEVRTPDDKIVTTMTQGDDGLARRAIAPGAYHLRIVHPQFVEAARDVEVQPGGVAEVRVPLEPRARQASVHSPRAVARDDEPHPTTGPGRALDRGVVATRRFLGRLGL